MTTHEPPPDPPRRAAVGGALLVLATLVALVPGVLVGRIPFLRDLSVFHRPLRRVLVDLGNASSGPATWNPYSHFGQPFAANPNSGVSDPWTLLYFALPFDLAFVLEILLPLLVGAAGFAWLVRTRGGGRAAAVFGALSWGFGGCALSVSGYLQMHHAVAVLPALLAAAMRLTQRRNALDFLALSVCLGLQGLAGSPTGLLLTALLLPFAVWDATRRAAPIEGGRRGLPSRLLVAVLVGLALGAATWWPAVRHLPHTARVSEESFTEEAAGWSLPPVRLLELAAPHAFGRVVPETVGWYWGRELYGWRQWPYLFSLHCGLGSLVLALTALGLRRREEAPWILAGGLGLCLSFGAHLPGWDSLLSLVPPLGVVRFPEKWAVAPMLVFVLLAARGLDLVLEGGAAAAMARRAAVVLAAILGLAALATRLADGAAWSAAIGVPSWLADEVAAAAASDASRQFALALALALLLWRGRLRVLPLLLLTAVELTLAGRALIPTAEPVRFDRPPSALQPLLADPLAGYLFQYADWKKHEVRRGGHELVVEPPAPWQWRIGTALEKDFDGTQFAWSRAATRELLALMARRPEMVGPILERRSVVAVLRPPQAGEPGALTLLATRDPAPLAFAADRVLVRAPGESLAAALEGLGPAAARGVVLEAGLEAPPLVGPAGIVGPASMEGLPGEAGAGAWRIEADVPGPHPAVLALNTSWHPGVRVESLISGSEIPVLRADGHLCAIVLPPGRHELVLLHHQGAVHQGRLLTLLGLVAAFGGAWRLHGGQGRDGESMAS